MDIVGEFSIIYSSHMKIKEIHEQKTYAAKDKYDDEEKDPQHSVLSAYNYGNCI